MRDAELRAATLQKLGRCFRDDPDTRIVEEMGIWSGAVRIDIAVINGEIHGYELKSARDTLTRLDSQAALYNQVFDRLTLVLAERHIDAASRAVPGWWGITIASSRDGVVTLKQARPPKRNPQPDPLQLARLMWRSELLSVLERHGIDHGVRTRTVEVMARRLAQVLPLLTLRREVRSALKARTHWLGQSVSDEGQVPVHTDLYPGRPAS